MLITEYIENLQSSGELDNSISSALNEYHKSDYEPIKPWDEVGGYRAKPKDLDTESNDYLSSSKFLKRFIKSHNIKVLSEKDSKTHLILYVPCPWSDSHTTPSNGTDCFISVDKRNGMINYHCNHSHCNDKVWQDYKRFYGGDKPEGNAIEIIHKKFDIKLVQGVQLQKTILPDIKYAIEGMIPEGSTVISAPFKSGKSWLVLQMALAVADGKDFLGMKGMQGNAVYLALEDSDKFAQERLNIATKCKDAPKGFYYIYEDVPTLDAGLIDYLEQVYAQLGDIRLIIIDTLALVECQAKRGESAYSVNYRTGRMLKQWADSKQTSIVLVTHTTKAKHEDIFENTQGTNGTTGACDSIVTLVKKKRSDNNAILAITGRRVRSSYHKIHMDDGCIWQYDGITTEEGIEQDQRHEESDKAMQEYKNSAIREAVIKIASYGIEDALTAKALKEKASEYNIYLFESPKDIGLFLHQYQTHFIKVDGVLINIIKNGTGPKRYKLKYYDDASEEEQKVFKKK